MRLKVFLSQGLLWNLLCVSTIPLTVLATDLREKRADTGATSILRSAVSSAVTSILSSASASSSAGVPSASPAIKDPASLVNLFIGVVNGGHVFPGMIF